MKKGRTGLSFRKWGCFGSLILLAGLLGSCGPQTTPPLGTTAAESTITETLPAPEVVTTTRPAIQTTPAGTEAQPSPTPSEPANLPGVLFLPDPANYGWQPLVGGLEKPVDLESPGDGSGRLFILEQAGRIRIVQDGALLPDPFLDIQNQVGSNGSERGLLGLEFSPAYASDGAFYLNYTDLRGNTVIARYHVSENPNQADSQSEEILLQVQQPYANHNGGGLAFGPDGYLYIGLGDGGSAGDPQGNGQSLETLLGKLLRIDVSQPGGVAVPSGNPYANGGGRPEIWAYGLRNPWRFSFDMGTGDLYIADVGQNIWEEIDYLPAGSAGGVNFGWSYREAAHPYAGSPPAGLTLVDPIYEYDHNQGCSVTGGMVYRGQAMPEWQGIYIFGDYCRGTVWGLLRDGAGIWQAKTLFETGANISAFGLDETGEVYLLNHSVGQILRLERR
jgi:glucose/arabinose dehydrogenase